MGASWGNLLNYWRFASSSPSCQFGLCIFPTMLIMLRCARDERLEQVGRLSSPCWTLIPISHTSTFLGKNTLPNPPIYLTTRGPCVELTWPGPCDNLGSCWRSVCYLWVIVIDWEIDKWLTSTHTLTFQSRQQLHLADLDARPMVLFLQ